MLAMFRVMRMNNSPIVKCSHCKQVFSSEDFDAHECDMPINDSKRIEVVYFRDDSYKDKKLMTGLGIDGVLYIFEMVPRKPIPFVLSSSDDGYHEPSNRRQVTRTVESEVEVWVWVWFIPPFVC
jgi:hypothetical protein